MPRLRAVSIRFYDIGIKHLTGYLRWRWWWFWIIFFIWYWNYNHDENDNRFMMKANISCLEIIYLYKSRKAVRILKNHQTNKSLKWQKLSGNQTVIFEKSDKKSLHKNHLINVWRKKENIFFCWLSPMPELISYFLFFLLYLEFLYFFFFFQFFKSRKRTSKGFTRSLLMAIHSDISYETQREMSGIFYFFLVYLKFDAGW